MLWDGNMILKFVVQRLKITSSKNIKSWGNKYGSFIISVKRQSYIYLKITICKYMP